MHYHKFQDFLLSGLVFDTHINDLNNIVNKPIIPIGNYIFKLKLLLSPENHI